MKFYNREIEIEQLDAIRKQSLKQAQMTFVVGRRRVGKTSLLKKAVEPHLYLYFFVGRKNEALLCSEFTAEIEQKLNVEIFGQINTFRDLFGNLLNLSKSKHFTLIIDEFQEFYSVNSSVYSEMQNLWDSHKQESKMNLILCGSVYSMMSKIFENSKEPLFGRANHRITVKKFDTVTLKKILGDYHPQYTAEDLLTLYVITGGTAKYIEILMEAGAFTSEKILNEVLKENSLFLDEGKNVLIEEFGKDYGNYFSILSLIASSKTSRPEIESVMGTTVGGFLERLEKDYELINRVIPFDAKPGSRNIKYRIRDQFLHFWFRFIFKYQSAVEIENLDFVRTIVDRNYATFTGAVLEQYFRDQLQETKKFSRIGTYWEKNNLNEIDIVAENALEKTMLIAEVKRNPKNISISALEKKAEKLIKKFPDYHFDFKGYSMNDI
ncbi:ATP-binding protein [Chryseobacterium koreense]|uniref:ATPase n=1 Tax=Chryseobacterium koreense CCUG 49689 TaxID=1304281 RepID=A0A0J7LT55_9FLAO|nr:ATP-binding protein [Chryseobacterium koreense]KMQ72130.1 ATPase [Chryseobacterium koreense CCUG 49689]MBB5331982.1 hypothetical protein [Chryseobacterium koreense]